MYAIRSYYALLRDWPADLGRIGSGRAAAESGRHGMPDDHARLTVNRSATAGRILVAEHDGVYLMKFVGDVRLTLCAAVDQFLDTMLSDPKFRSVRNNFV